MTTTPDPRKLWKEGKSLDEIARNPDGTYNGIKAMSAISGLDPREIEWTWKRLQRLMKVEKREKAEALAMVKAEAVSKPWERNP